jgi:hypothetical protein
MLLDSAYYGEKTQQLYLIPPRRDSKPDDVVQMIVVEDGVTLESPMLRYVSAVNLPSSGPVMLDTVYISSVLRAFTATARQRNPNYIFKLTASSDSVDGDDEGLKKRIYDAELFINTPLSFENSVLGMSAVFPRSEFDSVQTDGTIDTLELRVKKITFNKSVRFVRNYFLSLSFDKAHFRDTFRITLSRNFEYFRRTELRKNAPIVRANFRKSTFDSLVVLAGESADVDYSSSFNDEDTVFNLMINECEFRSDVRLQMGTLRSSQIEDCTFEKGVILRNVRIDSTTVIRSNRFVRLLDIRGAGLQDNGLSQNFFSRGCNIVISEEQKIPELKLDLISLSKVFLVIDWGWKEGELIWWDHANERFVYKFTPDFINDRAENPAIDHFNENHLEQVRLKFLAISEHVKTEAADNDLFGSDKQRALNWLKYQLSQYEKLYYKNTGSYKYYWYCFLDVVLNFGYDGELPFFITCLSFVLIFAIVYIILFKKDLQDYLKPDKQSVKERPKNKKAARALKASEPEKPMASITVETFKAFYLSFLIFFTPRVPVHYFSFSPRMVKFILVEWVIGTFFIVMFFIYIAGNYPIITKLLGI